MIVLVTKKSTFLGVAQMHFQHCNTLHTAKHYANVIPPPTHTQTHTSCFHGTKNKTQSKNTLSAFSLKTAAHDSQGQVGFHLGFDRQLNRK